MENVFYKSILDNVDFPICVFDMSDNFIYSNSAYDNFSAENNINTIKSNFSDKYIIKHVVVAESEYQMFIFSNNQAHQDFVSTVSHELRTPLTSIRGFADTMLMAQDKLSNEQRNKFLQIIRNQADRLTRLVENLLEITNMSKKNNSIFKEIDIKTFLNPIILLFEKKYPKRNYKISIEQNTPKIRADEDKLEQILTNIIDNASKYSQDNSTVTIQAGFSNDNVQIKVIDEGVKIPANQLENIFNKFSRIDNPLTRKVEGSGLGLFITKTLTEQLNGNIKAENYENGNIFTLSLPAFSAEKQLGSKFSEVKNER